MGKLDMDLLFGIVCGIAGIVMLIKEIYDRKTAIHLSGEIRDYPFLSAFCKCWLLYLLNLISPYHHAQTGIYLTYVRQISACFYTLQESEFPIKSKKDYRLTVLF